MKDIVSLVQTALDDALMSIPLYSFWMQRQEIDNDPNPDEYVVYTVDEHEPEAGADGTGLIYRSYVTVRYFCRESWLSDTERIQTARNHMTAVRQALLTDEFECSSGWQDVGDVDGISFITFVLTAEYAEVDRGEN